MNKVHFLILIILTTSFKADDWGFFAHRRINELAIYSLPIELVEFYKPYQSYIREHAVDPDKRRYATLFEGIRHYIDMDQWETFPIDTIPKYFNEALLQYTSIDLIRNNDTTTIKKSEPINWEDDQIAINKQRLDLSKVLSFFKRYIRPQYYEDTWKIEVDTFNAYFNTYFKGDWLVWHDHFSEHGVLPYHLQSMQYQLQKAFERKDIERILRLSAEMGHYIGDAHVPLHTTKNYNGQLTNQVGIHGFWESRIPELFANEEYDFFVDPAIYIEDKADYYWNVVKESHAYVDSVLLIEQRLRKIIPEDEQMCFDERLGRTVLTQCASFAKTYSKAMDGMVERRMRASIQSVASSWFTAWVDAGQPNFEDKTPKDELDSNYIVIPVNTSKFKARKHE